jgi:hypothetical protein
VEQETVEKLMEGLKAVDPAKFVKVERFCDPDIQMFERHTPVKLNGDPDPERAVKYFSSVMVNYKGQQYSQQFEVEASDLEEAVTSYRHKAAEIGGAMLENLANTDAARQLLLADNGGAKAS